MPPRADIGREASHFRFVPCVDGSGLAREIFSSQAWSVQPCVRPVGAFHMTAGHNVLRKQIKLESESIPADICLGLMIRNWAVYPVSMNAPVSPMPHVALL